MNINTFNLLPDQEAIALLLSCCYCQHWAKLVSEQRPYEDYQTLLDVSLAYWSQMGEAQILEAFAHHAKIGDVEALKDKFSKATKEQGQVIAATDEVIQALYQGNQTYEQKNGFIFIVCASGKSAEEMLILLNARINHDRATELKNASNEQAKILTLRLSSQIQP